MVCDTVKLIVAASVTAIVAAGVSYETTHV